MKPLFLFVAFLLACGWLTTPVQAQECGTSDYIKALEVRHPELAAKKRQTEERLRHQVGDRSAISGILTVPVVVHIVFNNAAENLPDARVFDQLAILNEDFRRFNADVTNAPDVFEALATDIQIQFCLASVDPDGNPTTGITRTSTTHGVFQYPSNSSINDDVKYTSDGGIDAWDTEEYLNIWVCDINGGVRGYAPYPGTASADEDGVVIDFNNFGEVGTARGRTAAHEVGHWFNLIHIWGDADCGDDSVSDTPKAKDSNGGCPTFPRQTADCNMTANGEMFSNHMDYSDHTCRVMFTPKQAERMRQQFESGGEREDLLDADGCGGSCPSARFLTADFAALNADLPAVNRIYAWNKIMAGSDVTYRAGDEIRLKQGTHILPGNSFRAYINGCAVGPKPSDGRDEAADIQIGSLSIAPNPANNSITIRADAPGTGPVMLRIVDLQGRVVWSDVQPMEPDVTVIQRSIDVQSFSTGIYFCALERGQTRWTQRLAIQR
jgi:hypothetical protein